MNSTLISKTLIVIIAVTILGNSKNLLAAPQFTIKQKLNLTDVSERWDKAVLKCALICGQFPTSISSEIYGTKSNLNAYSDMIFRGRKGMNFYNNTYIAALSQDRIIPINTSTGRLIGEQTIQFQSTPGYKPENIGAYVCAIELLDSQGNDQTYASDEAYNGRVHGNTSPRQANIKTVVAKNFSNPAMTWTSSDTQICRPENQ